MNLINIHRVLKWMLSYWLNHLLNMQLKIRGKTQTQKFLTTRKFHHPKKLDTGNHSSRIAEPPKSIFG